MPPHAIAKFALMQGRPLFNETKTDQYGKELGKDLNLGDKAKWEELTPEMKRLAGFVCPTCHRGPRWDTNPLFFERKSSNTVNPRSKLATGQSDIAMPHCCSPWLCYLSTSLARGTWNGASEAMPG